LHMHIFLGNAEQTKHTWVYDGNKKVIREDKYEFGYWENRKFYKNWVPDYKRVYSYSDEKLVSEMETNYSDFSARDSSKYIHGYIIEDNKIKKEEIRYYSSGFTDSPYHFQSTTILQYGYYPDKRIKQEDFYDPNQANPTETKVYIYE